jgi:hypothetical protein
VCEVECAGHLRGGGWGWGGGWGFVQASRQALEEEFPVESRVVEEIQTQTVEQASARPCPHLSQPENSAGRTGLARTRAPTIAARMGDHCRSGGLHTGVREGGKRTTHPFSVSSQTSYSSFYDFYHIRYRVLNNLYTG